MTLTPGQLGFVRALGVAVLMSVLTYLGDTAHLNGVLSASGAALISALALALEHAIESGTGSALFGAVSVKRQ